jgi:hypothetical protein
MAWVRIEDTVTEHRKHLKAGPAACWLWVCGIAYCQRQLSDGFIPIEAVGLLGVSRGFRPLVSRLLEVGLFDRVEGGYQVHDYHAYNATREEAQERRGDLHRVRSEAGRKGGLMSGAARQAKTEANVKQTYQAVTEAKRSPIPSHPIPYTEEKAAAAPPRLHQPREEPANNFSVITKLAHEAIDIEGVKADLGQLAEAVKSLCCCRGIDYNSEVIRKAVDSALHQRTVAS